MVQTSKVILHNSKDRPQYVFLCNIIRFFPKSKKVLLFLKHQERYLLPDVVRGAYFHDRVRV